MTESQWGMTFDHPLLVIQDGKVLGSAVSLQGVTRHEEIIDDMGTVVKKYHISTIVTTMDENGNIVSQSSTFSIHSKNGVDESIHVHNHSSINGYSPNFTAHELLDALPGLNDMNYCPVCGDHDSIWLLVQHLNDTHEESREYIADWIDSLDVNLTFGVPDGE